MENQMPYSMTRAMAIVKLNSSPIQEEPGGGGMLRIMGMQDTEGRWARLNAATLLDLSLCARLKVAPFSPAPGCPPVPH